MRLNRVHFTNFRSIRNAIIHFNPSCRILVGINESGKSNILRGLSFLNPNIDPHIDDLRETSKEEKDLDTPFIDFIFSLTEQDQNFILKTIKEKILFSDLNLPIIEEDSVELNIEELSLTLKEGIYRVNIEKSAKFGSYWTFQSQRNVLEGWKVPSKGCPVDYSITTDAGEKPLRTYSIIQTDAADNIPVEYLSDLTINRLHELLGSGIREYVENNIPKCIIWEYNDKNLLPASLDLNQFINDPTICIPLQRMFTLAGIKDIRDKVVEARKRSNGMRNLLDGIAEVTTKHIKKIWNEPEYTGISIDLRINGEVVECTVKDAYNLFNFERRSDGFKRFITFLIIISTQVNTKELENVLILTDEPDNGLHPSGIRHLRDEFIRISGANYVVLSTHSIFMVDREMINRHFIVEKHGEITTLKEADKSNIMDEEVIYNALGFSFAEVLEKNNLIFEGWKDKKLFRIATSHIPKLYNDIKDKLLNNLGYCHAQGAKNVKNITPILDLGNRDYIVISDNDKTAREYQSDFEGDGQWLRYDELLPEYPVITSEDFIKRDYIEKSIQSLMKTDDQLSRAELPKWHSDYNTLGQIHQWIRSNKIDDPKRIKDRIDRIKSHLFENLKYSNIREEYYKMLKNLSDKINSSS